MDGVADDATCNEENTADVAGRLQGLHDAVPERSLADDSPVVWFTLLLFMGSSSS